MRFKVLGPLEIWWDEQRVPVQGIYQRAALGFLLLHANQLVPTSHLLRALWPGDMPPTAKKMLYNAVSGLRAVLRAHDDESAPVRLVTEGPGYVLELTPPQLDLLMFEELRESGRAALTDAAYQAAADTMRRALKLWRGPVLADLSGPDFGWPQRIAIQGSRLAVLEDCAEAYLALGRYRHVIDLLEATVLGEPGRERMCAQLMIALYRSGRQSDALAVYRKTKQSLVQGLGLDPSPGLQAVERAILEHDPALGQASEIFGLPPAAEPQHGPQAVDECRAWNGKTVRGQVPGRGGSDSLPARKAEDQ